MDYSLCKSLIVDDDRDILGILTVTLQEIGFGAIERAMNGSIALEKIEEAETAFDLIVCDWVMPEMDGMAFLHAFRELGYQTPVIMLTSKGTVDAILEAKSVGISAYIKKPFARGDLMKKVISIMGEPTGPNS